MGYRFHRSVKIAKGVRLNISKNGLGLSVGPRGAKVSMNSKGVYTNFGIPGTGISSRKKIAGWHDVTGSVHKAGTLLEYRYRIDIDEETGKEELSVFLDGALVTDETVVRRIKRDPSYRKNLEKERTAVYRKIQGQTEVLTTICKHAQPLPDWDAMRTELKESKPKRYRRVPFPKTCPEREAMVHALEQEAMSRIHAVFFRRRKIAAYVAERIDDRYRDAMQEWDRKRQEHEVAEDNRERRRNAVYLQEYAEWKEEVLRILEPDESLVGQRLEELLSSIRLPMDFAVSFDVRDGGRLVVLDIDLPEIEDFPKKRARRLSTGKISIKTKSQKERNHDYLVSVTGLGFYFASIAFSVSPIVQTLLVSGFTQRIDKRDGNERNLYVYSVRFPVNAFRELNLPNLDPYEAIRQFLYRMQVTSTYEMKPIEPLSP